MCGQGAGLPGSSGLRQPNNITSVSRRLAQNPCNRSNRTKKRVHTFRFTPGFSQAQFYQPRRRALARPGTCLAQSDRGNPFSTSASASTSPASCAMPAGSNGALAGNVGWGCECPQHRYLLVAMLRRRLRARGLASQRGWHQSRLAKPPALLRTGHQPNAGGNGNDPDRRLLAQCKRLSSE